MKTKTINLLLALTSLIGYLEWGDNNHMFLFQGEYEIITKLFSDPTSVIHPFILMPLVGQILLLVTLFQKKPSRILTLAGLIGIGILLLFIFILSLLSFNWKVMLSTLPFLITGFIAIRNRK